MANSPESLARASDLLKMAANIKQIASYDSCSDNKAPQLCCRIFTPVQQTAPHVLRLASRLNMAIQPILSEFALDLERQALLNLGADESPSV